MFWKMLWSHIQGVSVVKFRNLLGVPPVNVWHAYELHFLPALPSLIPSKMVANSWIPSLAAMRHDWTSHRSPQKSGEIFLVQSFKGKTSTNLNRKTVGTFFGFLSTSKLTINQNPSVSTKRKNSPKQLISKNETSQTSIQLHPSRPSTPKWWLPSPSSPPGPRGVVVRCRPSSIAPRAPSTARPRAARRGSPPRRGRRGSRPNTAMKRRRSWQQIGGLGGCPPWKKFWTWLLTLELIICE